MMLKRFGLFVFLLLISTSTFSEEIKKFWISFKDKSGVTFNPPAYFDQKTIQNRLAQHIPICDSTDFPVNKKYLQAVTALCYSTSYSSRWLNGVAVYATLDNISKIKLLACVSAVSEMNSKAMLATIGVQSLIKGQLNELLQYQTGRMQGKEFIKHNLDGKGIRIAVFDAGFPGVNKHAAFEGMRKRKQIIATYDFIKKREDVYHFNPHGTATLSCIGGFIDTTNIGLATGAEFLLARTEYGIRETFSEEENWLAAVEWADKNGANIISSSLGYTGDRYFNTQMDGRHSLVSRAATMAAKKGILVVNAAGNEGLNTWHFIDTPGDADSILTVGGINPYTDFKIDFSSVGPTSDGRLKPNVVAVGEAIVAVPNGYAKEFGTSFSTPLVAGFAACTWQLHRDWTNMQLFDGLEKAASLYPYFDYAHGFGIPQADRIIAPPLPVEPTFDFVIINDDIKVILREKYSYSDEETALGYSVRRNFYYKTEDSTGTILNYNVLLAEKKEMLHFMAGDFNKGDVITVHFEGYTNSLDFQGEINEQK